MKLRQGVSAIQMLLQMKMWWLQWKLQLQENQLSDNTGSLQMSRISAKKCVTVMCLCSYQTQPLHNLWQPKDQYLLICTGSENRKGSLERRALPQMEISSRIHKILSYFSKFRAFYLYVIYHDPIILCVLQTNSDCQVSQGHGWFYKSRFYLWSRRNTENTAGGFFDVCFGGCSQ